MRDNDDFDSKVVPINDYVRVVNEYVEKAFNFPRDGEASMDVNAMWKDETRSIIDPPTLKHLFFAEDWVFILIDLCALKISSQPLKVNRSIIGDDGSVDINEVPGHRLQAMLDDPNPYQGYTEWMYNTVVEDVNQGNAIVWHAQQNNWLITMPAERIVPEIGDDGIMGYYLNQTREDQPGALFERKQNSVAFFDEKEVAHIMRPNPSSMLWGLSGLVPAQKAILFNRYTMDYLNAFYQKQATPGMVITIDRNQNEDVALRMLRTFELAYSGRRNARRNMVLPKGVKAESISHRIADQDLLGTVGLNRETLINIIKAPKHELGLQTAGSLGSEEHKIALRNFWDSQLIPTQKRIAGKLTKHFRRSGLLADNEMLLFDNSDVSALKDDLMKKALTAKEMLAAGLSVNEVRRDVWEESPSTAPGSDEPYVLRQQQNPMLGGFGSGFSQPAEPAINPDDIKKKLRPSKALKDFNASVQKQLDQEMSGTASRMEELVVSILVRMAEKSIEVIADQLVEKGSNPKRIKAEVPSKRALRRELNRAIQDLEDQYVDGSVSTLTASVELGFDQQLQLVVNEQDKRRLEALKGQGAGGRRALLEERGIETFAGISKTQTDKILRAIVEGAEAGKTIDEITGDVIDSLGTRVEIQGRANTIARTETLTAVSVGQAGAMEAAKEVFPEGLKKAWLTADDDRVRDTHSSAQSEGAIDVDEPFSNGLMYPRDVSRRGAPEEVINCRCTLAIIPPGESENLGFEEE